MASSTSTRVLRVGRYVLLDTIGEGAFGVVKLAVNEETGDEFAVKILAKNDILAHDLTLQVRREITVMKALKHPSIVNLIEVLTSAKHLYIVIELVTGGELFDLVANHGRLSEHLARRYFHQLVDAVAYCHSRRVYHRDLKPENLLLSEDGSTLKITDFGLSSIKRADTSDELLHTVTGSPHYLPPEMITHASNGYEGDKADSWAVGMILFGMLAGFLPFDDTDTSSLYRKIVHQQVEYPSHFSASVITLLQELFRKDPKKRVNMERVREFEWFKVDYQPRLCEPSTTTGLYGASAQRRRRKRAGSSIRRQQRRQIVTDGDGSAGDAASDVQDPPVGRSTQGEIALRPESMSSHAQSSPSSTSQPHLQVQQDSVPTDKHDEESSQGPTSNDVTGPMRPTSLRAVATTAIMPTIGKSRHDSLPVSRVPRRPHARLHKRAEDESEGGGGEDNEQVKVSRVDSEPFRGQTKRRGAEKVGGGTGSAIAAAFRRPFWKRHSQQQQQRNDTNTSNDGGTISSSDVPLLQLDRAPIDEPISGSGSRSMNLLSKAREFASARSTRASRKSMGWEPETPPSSLHPQAATVATFQHTSPISPDAPTSMPSALFKTLRTGIDDRLRTKPNRGIPSRRSDLRSSNTTTVHSTPRESFDSSVLSTPVYVTSSRGSGDYDTPPHSIRSAGSARVRQFSLGERPTGATSSNVRSGTPVPSQQSISPQQSEPAGKAAARDELGESRTVTRSSRDNHRRSATLSEQEKRTLTTNELSMHELPRTSISNTIESGDNSKSLLMSSQIFKPTKLELVSKIRAGCTPPHPLCPKSLHDSAVNYPVWAIDEAELFDDVDAPSPRQVRPLTPKPTKSAQSPPQKPAAPPPKRTIFAPLNSAFINELSVATREVPLEKTNPRASFR